MSTKDMVIEALEREKGCYVSGEALAQACGVSRNAVWKAVTDLKELGYAIRSTSKRGYLLEADSDVISRAGICLCLDQAAESAGAAFPCRIYVHDELDSTNSEAKRLLCSGEAPHGTLVVAKRQTAGRGHGGSRFSSPEGGIYLSLVLQAGKLKWKSPPLAERVADSVCGILEQMAGAKLGRRKDSSLYLGRDKLCGILTEGIADLEAGTYSDYIVGIGIHSDMLGAALHKNEMIARLVWSIVNLFSV